MLHVLWSGEVGGVERLARDLAEAQLGSGLEAAVAFARDRGPLGTELADRGVPTFELGLSSGYDLRPRPLRGASVLMRAWDVIHLHGFNVPIALAAGRAGRPIVLTDHGSIPRGGRRAPAAAAKRGLLARFIRRSAVTVVANSRHTAERARHLYGLAPAEVTLIHNGIPPRPTSAARVGDDDSLVVAYLGRLVHFKRVDRLLEAVAALPPEAAIRVVVIGGGPLEPELTALARRLRLGPRVAFLGLRRDTESLLAGADVLVQPSQGEPFGLAILEGCAEGVLPVAFADGGGALEVLPPDGRVVKDPAELAGLLAGLAGSPDLSPDARRARAAWALRTFPIERTAEAYESVYRAAVASGPLAGELRVTA